MEQIVRLQQLADFDHGAMDDRIGDNGTEKSGLELSTFLEVLRPFAARLWKSKVGACGQAPGRLKHRFDPGHETGLSRRNRIRFGSGLSQHSLQQSGLLGSGRHALTVDRVEPAERIGDRQHPAREATQAFEMLPNARGKAVVPDAFQRPSVTQRTEYCWRDQSGKCGLETLPTIQPRT